ncbi:MAG: GNAT family N-acetyltransferase [Ktedonobacteraceae bacterium]|nr:GNAT family N-acetyltransferase [Ktedonobacteraceae bacterium]
MVTGPITIRQATTEDIPFLQEMIWEAMLASPTFLALYGVETMRHAEKQYWERWLEHPDPAFVAIDETGQKLGAMTVKPNDTQEPVRSWRIGLAVQAHVRGQGIGQRLLERASAFAREKGADYVNLFVDPTNTRAIALYRRVGFIEDGEQDQMLEMRIDLNS